MKKKKLIKKDINNLGIKSKIPTDGFNQTFDIRGLGGSFPASGIGDPLYRESIDQPTIDMAVTGYIGASNKDPLMTLKDKELQKIKNKKVINMDNIKEEKTPRAKIVPVKDKVSGETEHHVVDSSGRTRKIFKSKALAKRYFYHNYYELHEEVIEEERIGPLMRFILSIGIDPKKLSKDEIEKWSNSQRYKTFRKYRRIKRIAQQNAAHDPNLQQENFVNEKHMTKTEKEKEEKLKDKYDDSEMKEKMIKQYGEKKGKEIYFATIRKQAMKEDLDEGSIVDYSNRDNLIKHLKKLGWKQDSEGSKHTKFIHPKTTKHIAVPRHKVLNKVLSNRLAKEASVLINESENKYKNLLDKIMKGRKGVNKEQGEKVIVGGKTLTGKKRNSIIINPIIKKKR